MSSEGPLALGRFEVPFVEKSVKRLFLSFQLIEFAFDEDQFRTLAAR
jgi:hypothetical protein